MICRNPQKNQKCSEVVSQLRLFKPFLSVPFCKFSSYVMEGNSVTSLSIFQITVVVLRNRLCMWLKEPSWSITENFQLQVFHILCYLVQRDLIASIIKEENMEPPHFQEVDVVTLFQRICHLKLKCLQSLKANRLPSVCYTRQAKIASLSLNWKCHTTQEVQ